MTDGLLIILETLIDFVDNFCCKYDSILTDTVESSVHERFQLQWQKVNGQTRLVAAKKKSDGNSEFLPVTFRRVNTTLAIQFIRSLHYIHTDHEEVDAFGLFLGDDDLPFAIETVQRTSTSPQFRQDALLIKGFDPALGIELTRLYTWPGSPRNIIGVIDRMVVGYFKSVSNIEVVITTVTPSYAKTRSTTIAGGIDRVLYARRLSHKFVRRELSGKTVWEHTFTRNLKENGFSSADHDVVETNHRFPLYPTLGVYKQIGRKRSLNEIPQIQGKVIGFDFVVC